MKFIKNYLYIFIVLLLIIISLMFINRINYNKKNEENNKLINSIIYKDGKYKYNEWSNRLLKEIIISLQNYLTKEEITNLFDNVYAINYNNYDDNEPNKTIYDRASNTLGVITINGKENESIDNYDKKEMLLLLSHEILHSLGDFSSEKLGNLYTSNYDDEYAFLEEGMAYLLGENISNNKEFSSFVVYNDEMFKMFKLNDDLTINRETNRAYTISYNIVYKIYALGCFDNLIDSNIDGNWNSLRSCMINNYGNDLSNKFFENIDKIYLFVKYPNMIFDKDEAINWFFYSDEIKKIINSNNIVDLLKELSNTTINMLNVKYNKILKDNNYSKKIKKKIINELDEYKKQGLIYFVDGTTFYNSDFDKLVNYIKNSK